MAVYYNEYNHKKAAWLRELINEGVIAPGDVDERPIQEVNPEDVAGYTQCHWFAGIGVWSYALRIAGWDDSRPVWTGSCPCQSFSGAGKQKGFDDPRHLWPTWSKLIEECRPPVVFGEQVEAAIRKGWLDLVQDDLEAEDYTFGAIVLPACSIGAPHLRQRLWFMANASQESVSQKREQCPEKEESMFSEGSDISCLSDSSRQRSQGHKFESVSGGREWFAGESSLGSNFWDRRVTTNQYRDGKQRRIKSGIKPMVNVAPGNLGQMCDRGIEEIDFDNTPEARTMRIEGYGDAIVAELAAEFIATNMEWLEL